MSTKKAKLPKIDTEQVTRNVNAMAWDAGNRHAEARGAKKIGTGRFANWSKWNRDDYNAAAREANRLFAALGFPTE